MDKLADEVHKQKLKTFTTRKVYAKFVNEIWSCDLVDLSFWQDNNDGYKFLLTVVDVLSKYAWAKKLKNKSADEVVKAFEELFKEAIPKKIWTDQGSEFYNKQSRDKKRIFKYPGFFEQFFRETHRFSAKCKIVMLNQIQAQA